MTGALIEQQQTACRAWLSELQRQAEDLKISESYDRLVFEFRISQMKAMLDWLDTCRQSLPVA